MQGIFFDLGGTLYSYRNVPKTTAALVLEAAARFGISGDDSAIKDTYTRAVKDTTTAYADKAYYLHRDFFDDTLLRFAELLGAEPDEAVCAWYRAVHRAAVIECLELRPDCLDTLKELRARGLYLSIVSNIDDDMLNPLVAKVGLNKFVDHWTSSEAAQSCKPDRRFFEVALEMAGLPAQAVLFVGDSPEHDVVGANAAGMTTALIVDGGMEPPLQSGRATVRPDHTIHTLGQLRDIVPG